MKNQKGFTLIHLVGLLVALLWLAFVGGLIWVACHFIAKFW